MNSNYYRIVRRWLIATFLLLEMYLPSISGQQRYVLNQNDVTIGSDSTIQSYTGSLGPFSAFVIPKTLGIKGIGESVFRGLKADTLIVCDGVKTFGFACFLDHDFCSVYIGDGTTFIDTSAFQCLAVKRRGITSLRLPNSLEVIGGGAFSRAVRLDTLVLPSEIREIHEAAFTFGLIRKHIVFNDKLRVLGGGAFKACGMQDDILYIPPGLSTIECFSSCEFKRICLPPNIREIGYSAFFSCRNLSCVEFSEGLVSIKNNAFKDCYSIETLVFPNTLQTIGNTAFMKCFALDSVVFGDGLTEIGRNAFSFNENMQSSVFPPSLKTIGASAFECCYKLQAELPENLTSLGERAFYRCDMRQIRVPASIGKVVPKQAFYTNAKAELIEVQEGITEIGESAFAYCYQTEVRLPSTLTHIRPSAFYYTLFPPQALPAPPQGKKWMSYKANDDGTVIPVEEVTYIGGDHSGLEEYAKLGFALFDAKGEIATSLPTDVGDNVAGSCHIYRLDGKLIYSGRKEDAKLGHGIYVVRGADGGSRLERW